MIFELHADMLDELAEQFFQLGTIHTVEELVLVKSTRSNSFPSHYSTRNCTRRGCYSYISHISVHFRTNNTSSSCWSLKFIIFGRFASE